MLTQALSWLRYFFLFQSGLVCILSFLFWFFQNTEAAFSGLLGGVIGIVPNLYFARHLFKKTGAQHAKAVLSNFYIGEILKWLLTLALFTVSLQWSKLKVLPLFTVFIATQLVYWVIPFIISNNIRDKSR